MHRIPPWKDSPYEPKERLLGHAGNLPLSAAEKELKLGMVLGGGKMKHERAFVRRMSGLIYTIRFLPELSNVHC